jgi:hypothetical protein
MHQLKTSTAATAISPEPQARERAEQAPADGAREHTEQVLTPEQATPVMDDGLGAWTTAPVETELRDIDGQYSARENEELPFLAARMVVSDYKPQAYGRRTEVWLDYGRTTGALTPAEAREALAAMRGFCDRLEAVVVLAEESAAGDFEGDPEIARLDLEAEDRRIRAITEGRA